MKKTRMTKTKPMSGQVILSIMRKLQLDSDHFDHRDLIISSTTKTILEPLIKVTKRSIESKRY